MAAERQGGSRRCGAGWYAGHVARRAGPPWVTPPQAQAAALRPRNRTPPTPCLEAEAPAAAWSSIPGLLGWGAQLHCRWLPACAGVLRGQQQQAPSSCRAATAATTRSKRPTASDDVARRFPVAIQSRLLCRDCRPGLMDLLSQSDRRPYELVPYYAHMCAGARRPVVLSQSVFKSVSATVSSQVRRSAEGPVLYDVYSRSTGR